MSEPNKQPRIRRRSKLVFFRVEAGLTQEDVASRLKVHVGTIKRHEGGQSNITSKQLEEYAKLYGCKVVDLISEEEAEERIASLYGAVKADYSVAASKSGPSVTLPAPLGGIDLAAVKVSEDIFPLFRKGDLLVVDTGKQFVAKGCIGRMCLVEINQSSAIIGVFSNGNKANHYDITRPNGTLLRDKKILAAYPIKAIFKS